LTYDNMRLNHSKTTSITYTNTLIHHRHISLLCLVDL